MNQWFAQPALLLALAALPVLLLLALHAARRRRRALESLRVWPWHADLVLLCAGRRRTQTALLLAGLALLTIGAAGPRWGRDWSAAAMPRRDLVVVLDVSRSMLARDVLPDRLQRAKHALATLADMIQQTGNRRLALVIFAGRARSACPLTYDYDFFREALAASDADDPLVAPVASGRSQSGTRLGAAIQLAAQTHEPGAVGRQEILLLSDGDDPAADGEWRAGTAAARAAQIPVHVVGLGDPQHASEIPIAGRPLVGLDGRPVLTRLDEGTLRAIAAETGGLYVPARTADFDLGQLFRSAIETRMIREETQDVLPQYRLRYAWFYAPAFFLLAMMLAIGDRRGPAPARALHAGESA